MTAISAEAQSHFANARGGKIAGGKNPWNMKYRHHQWVERSGSEADRVIFQPGQVNRSHVPV